VTRNLALDLKPIRVNCVSPGAVKTELWDGMDKEARDKMMKAVAEKVPTGRVGQRKWLTSGRK
jgi:NAD(P)-dependent dehydrogenase (short-subunit alcohol dehydrogenase family)